jgi:hypothetical protein
MFSSLVKTLKIEKCFVAGNNFPDKLACWFHRSRWLESSINKARLKNVPGTGKSRTFAAIQQVPAMRLLVFLL